MNTELLKKKILQLAMQGKLVEQDESDGTADELIDKIIEEKKQLMAEGKIKKEKLSRIYKNPTDNHYYEKFEDGKEKDITADIPYEIPSNWCWSKLRNIGIYKKGPFGSSLTKSIFVPKGIDTIKVYEQKNAINKDSKLGDYYITNKYFKENMSRFEVKPGDIIVSCAGTIGETYILPDTIEKGIINQALMKMKIINYIDVKFFLIYFDQTLKKESVKKGKGTAIKNIPPFSIFKEYLIPIPPKKEQGRMVAKIEELFKKVESINKHYNRINKLKELLKSKIIDMAIKGKLTKQLPTDEPSSKLIKNILEEKRKLMKEDKIKKENLSVIYKDSTDNQFYEKFDDGKVTNITDKIPYNIPSTWEWGKLSSLVQFIFAGGDKPRVFSKTETNELKIPVISNGEKNNGISGYTDEPTVKNVAITVSGRGTIGYTMIRYNSFVPIVRLITIIPFENLINIEYLKIVINHLINKGKGSAVQQLTVPMIAPTLIPLPPLEEQKRIVSTINLITNII